MENRRIRFGVIRLTEEAERNVLDVLKSNQISGGPKVKEFEEKWGKTFDYKHSVAVSSGTSADMAACMTLYDFGAKREDEIIAPALAFAAVGNSIIAAGFTPKFVDIRKETLNIDPTKIEEAITPRTKAIFVAHTMGKPCEMDKIMDIAKRHGLYVIEDSCEAHGAQYKGRFIGNWGDMATFSYYVAHLICSAEGGMVSTNNDKMAEVLRSVRSHGRKGGQLYFDHERFGLNFKMNDIEAALGLSQMAGFWDIFNKRRENILRLIEKTRDLQDHAWFNTEGADEKVCGHAFSVTLKDPRFDAAEMKRYLEAEGISCKRNFGSMPTQHTAFSHLGYKIGDFPEAEYVGDNGIHLGCHQYLTEDDLDYISEKLHNYFHQKSKLIG